MNNYAKGDIIKVNYDLDSLNTNVYDGVCDAVVLSNNKGNLYSPTLIVAPVINERPTDELYARVIDNEGNDRFVLIAYTRCIDKSRVTEKVSSIAFWRKLNRRLIEMFNTSVPYGVFRRGSVAWVDLCRGGVDAEQSGFRPSLIIGGWKNIRIVVPATSHLKLGIPTHLVHANSWSKRDCTFLFEQMRAVAVEDHVERPLRVRGIAQHGNTRVTPQE